MSSLYTFIGNEYVKQSASTNDNNSIKFAFILINVRMNRFSFRLRLILFAFDIIIKIVFSLTNKSNLQSYLIAVIFLSSSLNFYDIF